MNRVRGLLQLVRLPNLFTAVADVVAGFLFVGSGMVVGQDLVLLCCASVCFYAGGAALNDVCDVRRDAIHRPGRPIPSGAVSHLAALCLAMMLLFGGWILCSSVSGRSFKIGSALVISILCYDGWFKRTPIAPGLMGLCRAFNLLLGMSAADVRLSSVHLFVAVLMWLYVSSLTLFARGESTKLVRWSLSVGSVGMAGAIVGLVGLERLISPVNDWYLLLVGVMLGEVLVHSQRAKQSVSPAAIRRAVGVLVLLIVVFDASLVFAARGPLLAASVLALAVPTMALANRFDMS